MKAARARTVLSSAGPFTTEIFPSAIKARVVIEFSTRFHRHCTGDLMSPLSPSLSRAAAALFVAPASESYRHRDFADCLPSSESLPKFCFAHCPANYRKRPQFRIAGSGTSRSSAIVASSTCFATAATISAGLFSLIFSMLSAKAPENRHRDLGNAAQTFSLTAPAEFACTVKLTLYDRIDSLRFLVSSSRAPDWIVNPQAVKQLTNRKRGLFLQFYETKIVE
jgi:hypothetical protein